MRSKSHPFFRSTTILVLSAIAFACPAHSQAPSRAARDVVETTPNLIRKTGAYGSELFIDSEEIAERTPCEPSYPHPSVKNGETGTVILELMINKSGFVSRARVAETSGFRELDRAAMIGFLGCRFKPVLKDEIPTEAWIRMQHVWSLK